VLRRPFSTDRLGQSARLIPLQRGWVALREYMRPVPGLLTEATGIKQPSATSCFRPPARRPCRQAKASHRPIQTQRARVGPRDGGHTRAVIRERPRPLEGRPLRAAALATANQPSPEPSRGADEFHPIRQRLTHLRHEDAAALGHEAGMGALRGVELRLATALGVTRTCPHPGQRGAGCQIPPDVPDVNVGAAGGCAYIRTRSGR